MRIRIPYDSEYTASIGTAIYVFAYYEWAMIYLIQQFKAGFVGKYCRGIPMTSGQVKNQLKAILQDPQTAYIAISKSELEACFDEFECLIKKRNALIHAHPITERDGSQILHHQTKMDQALPDMKWPIAEVERVIHEFDDAACSANALLHRLLKAGKT